jgi:two-component system, OmpR family, phosphate regulon response regulator PhoB
VQLTHGALRRTKNNAQSSENDETMFRPSVLVVEDDLGIAELLLYTLDQSGFLAARADSAERALDLVRTAVPSLALIDWMLPGISGIALVQKLRQEARTAQLPIIMVTARADASHHVTGLGHGADDYVAKPFSPRELVARIRAVLRRRAPEHADLVLTVGEIELDPLAHRVSVAGRRIELRDIEFKLLRFFASHPDCVFSRSNLLDRVWGDHVFIEERTVDVHVRRLRMALGQAAGDTIVTVRGGGYKLISRAASGLSEAGGVHA